MARRDPTAGKDDLGSRRSAVEPRGSGLETPIRPVGIGASEVERTAPEPIARPVAESLDPSRLDPRRTMANEPVEDRTGESGMGEPTDPPRTVQSAGSNLGEAGKLVRQEWFGEPGHDSRARFFAGFPDQRGVLPSIRRATANS